MSNLQSNIQDKAKEAMHRAQEAINTVQEVFEGDTASNIKGKAQMAGQMAKDTWADTKVALGMEKPRWTSQHPYLLNTFIALAALLFVIGAGYALAKFARSRQAQKRVSPQIKTTNLMAQLEPHPFDS